MPEYVNPRTAARCASGKKVTVVVDVPNEGSSSPSSSSSCSTCFSKEDDSALSFDHVLVTKLGNAMQAVARVNDDKFAHDNSRGDDFTGRSIPHVSPRSYLKRVLKYTDKSGSESSFSLSIGAQALLAAVIYIDRLVAGDRVQVTSFSIHRLVAVGMLVALKMNEDALIDLKYYSALVGVSVAELERMELAFISKLEWHCVVDAQEFEARAQYIDTLIKRHRASRSGGSSSSVLSPVCSTCVAVQVM